MADVTVTPVAQTMATRSADLKAAGASVTAGQTFAIASPSGSLAGQYAIFLEEQNAGVATVTFDAGDNPPALLAGEGALAISLAQDDQRLVWIESARHCQNDGTITGSVATNTVKIYV